MLRKLFRDRTPPTEEIQPPEGLLRAVPHTMSGVSVHYHEGGTAQVRFRLNTRSWLGRLMKTKKTVTRERFFNLDQAGTSFWRHINGSTDLNSIAEILARSENRPLPESQRGVIQYTRILMTRGLIGIEVGQERSARRSKRKPNVGEARPEPVAGLYVSIPACSIPKTM